MNKEIALKWYKQALHDLVIAERNISIQGYDTASFLAQQSVEKLLKSIFALEGNKIPKTHYIDELAKQLNLSDEIIDNVLDLTVDYTFARYPDVADLLPYEEYTEEIAQAKVARAKKIFELLKDRYREIGEAADE
ncbi:MAG TPA: HEPN domain-containing protein [Caldithrix sp.]|nr:HEPN domain-containing protein [Caldithrix sp.]